MVFLNEQSKEKEENNGMGKTRDLFKKIENTKGTFHARMGMKKDRNGKDLTEAEEIKKRWQEYTELYKKSLNDPDSHDGVDAVVTQLQQDILECEVKWAWKRSVFIPVSKKGNTKECSNYHTIAFISHASKVMLQILQGFNSRWTENFQMYKLNLQKEDELEIKLPTLLD